MQGFSLFGGVLFEFLGNGGNLTGNAFFGGRTSFCVLEGWFVRQSDAQRVAPQRSAVEMLYGRVCVNGIGKGSKRTTILVDMDATTKDASEFGQELLYHNFRTVLLGEATNIHRVALFHFVVVVQLNAYSAVPVFRIPRLPRGDGFLLPPELRLYVVRYCTISVRRDILKKITPICG